MTLADLEAASYELKRDINGLAAQLPSWQENPKLFAGTKRTIQELVRKKAEIDHQIYQIKHIA